MVLKIKILWIVAALIFTGYFSAFAFFQQKDRVDNLRIEEKSIDKSLPHNNQFNIYDNFISPDSEKYLIKHKKGFVAPDQISIHIPMTVLVRDSFYPETSIDRMMMANLRAKKLYDEYVELQKRAQQMVRDDSAKGKPNEKKAASSTAASGREDKEGQIEQINETLQKRMSQVYFLGHIREDTEFQANQIAFEYPGSINAENSAPNKETSQSGTPAAIIDGKGSMSSSGQQMRVKRSADELPWIFKLPLKIFSYIANNRLEIMIYIISMAVIVLLVSMKMKR